jgi:hypothetical protein
MKQSRSMRISDRRFDSLVAYVTDWAGTRRKAGMVVPYLSNRRPQHERQEHDREHQPPNPPFIRHF